MTSLYIDENKGRSYILVAVAIHRTDAGRIRKHLRGLVLPGQRRLHFKKESDSRKRAIISTLVTFGACASVFESTAKSAASARESCLMDLVAFAGRKGHDRLVLERDESIERADHRVLFRELDRNSLRGMVEYSFEAPRTEPLLWIPDAIAWSLAKGGDWRRRIDPLLVGSVDG